MTPEELLARARQALQDGKDPAAVDSLIAEATGGDFEGVDALAASIRPGPTVDRAQAGLLAPSPDPREAAQERLQEVRGEGPGGTALDYIRLAEQGATFGLGDEIAGALAAVPRMIPGGESPGEAYTRVRDRSNQWVEDARLVHGLPANAAEFVGGLGTGLGGMFRSGATAAARSGRILPAAGRAAATGAAEGAVAGFGYSEGNPLERLPGAAFGATVGGVGGGLLGGGLATLAKGQRLLRTARKPVPEIEEVAGHLSQRAIREQAPIDQIFEGQGTLRKLREHAENQVERVRREFYDPIEEAFPEIDDPDILGYLRGTKGGSEIKEPIRWATRQVMGADMEESLPSFRQIQSIEKRLRGRASKAAKAGDPAERQAFSQAAGELRAAMERRIPGYAQAQAAYRSAKASVDALEAGQKAWGRGSRRNRPEQIQEQLMALPTDEARRNFRAGAASVAYDEITKRSGEITSEVAAKNLTPAMRRRYRLIFEDPADAREFFRHFEEAGDIAAALELLKTVAIRGAQIAGIGGAAGYAGSLFD